MQDPVFHHIIKTHPLPAPDQVNQANIQDQALQARLAQAHLYFLEYQIYLNKINKGFFCLWTSWPKKTKQSW